MDQQSPQPQQSDEDIVQIIVKIYCTNHEHGEPTAYLVGERGMYYPKHEGSMIWLPKGLIHAISAPADDGTQIIKIPRWLSAKKGLKYHD